MIKKLLILTLIVFPFTSCVSSKLYKELEGKYTTLKKDYDNLNMDSERILSAKNALQNQFDQLQNEYDATLSSGLCISYWNREHSHRHTPYFQVI